MAQIEEPIIDCCTTEIIVVITAAGILTGLIHYLEKRLRIPKEDREGWLKDGNLYLSIFRGIVGAYIIPLFLYLTNAELLGRLCENCSVNLLILFGFSLIGGYFSKSILLSVANKLDLQEHLDSLDKKVTSIQKKEEESKFEDVQNVKEVSAEDLVKSSDISERIEEKSTIADMDERSFAETTKKLFTAMNNPKFKYRSLAGLQKETKVEEMLIRAFLGALVSKDLIEVKVKKGVKYYALTAAGKEIMLE